MDWRKLASGVRVTVILASGVRVTVILVWEVSVGADATAKDVVV